MSILEALNRIPEMNFINEMTKDPKHISKRNFSKQVFRDRHFGNKRQAGRHEKPEDRIGIGRNVFLGKDPSGENVLPGGNEQGQAVSIPRTDAMATDYDHELFSDMDFFDTDGEYYGEDLPDYDSYYDDYESGYAKPEQDAGIVPVPGFDDTEDLNESYNWSKFVKDFAKRERKNTLEAKQKRIDENSPQREYNKRYREDWRNSTRWTK